MKNKIEFSLIYALLFLRSGARNVIISTLVCVLAGVAYYYGGARIYEASVTIQLNSNSREMIDASILLEKIKLTQYFSEMTIKACDSNTEPNYGLMPRVIKFERNKHAPLIKITKQAATAEMAVSCLNLVTLEIIKEQEKNIYKLPLLNPEELIALKKLIKKANKIMKSDLNKDNMSAAQILSLDLLNQTKFCEAVGNKTDTFSPYNPTSMVGPIYVFEVSKNKQFASALGFLLLLGSFFGLLITLVMRELPDILLQMRLAGGDNVKS